MLIGIVKALQINTNNEYALAGKGTALDNQGNYDQALLYLDKSLEINPNDQTALRIKSAIFQVRGNYDQALLYLDRLLAVNPNDELTLFTKSVVLFALNRNDEALTYDDRILEIDPNNHYALAGKAGILSAQGNCEQALTYADKGLSINPANSLAQKVKNDFNRIVDTFQRLYPGIFKALEDRWKDEVDRHTNLLEYYEPQGLKCEHKWKDRLIYKMGKYYTCQKCQHDISSNRYEINTKTGKISGKKKK